MRSSTFSGTLPGASPQIESADELAEAAEGMRHCAFEARCKAANAPSAETGSFWSAVAVKLDGIADDYERLRLRYLH